MTKKTIAIIGESWGATGKGLYPVELSKFLVKLKSEFNIKLFTRDTNPYNSDIVVKVKTLKTKIRGLAGLGYYIPLFFKLWRDKSIDVIHAYDEKISATVSLLKKPQIATVYDLYPIRFNKFPLNYFFKVLYHHLNKNRFIITISKYVGNLLSREFPKLSRKIVPIHLGVDIDRFKPPKRRSEKSINIGILCNLDQDLWRAFERILKDYGGRVKIMLAGRDIPPEFNYLRSHPGVIFKGFIEEKDLSGYYQDIDIFAYKSDIAAFELIPLEAMASGCAVVTSNVGALPEVIQNGGLLVEDTEEGFYRAIKNLVDNKETRLKYQKQGRERAKELTWEKCAERHLKLYKEILK